MEDLAAFKELSADLQAKIKARPTNTFLKDSTSQTLVNYQRLGKLFNLEDPDPKRRAPESFDGRISWKGLLGPIEDQGGCGSCWAFASTAALAQRFNIQSRGLMNIGLSQTKLILCDWGGAELGIVHPELAQSAYLLDNIEKGGLHNAACYGNTLLDACRYLYQIGTPTEECIPYKKVLKVDSGSFNKLGAFSRDSPTSTQLPLCSSVTGLIGDMCLGTYIDNATGEESGTPERFYRAYHFYGLYGTPGEDIIGTDGAILSRTKKGGEIQIRREVWRWGPVATGMRVYPDFYTFNAAKDIYKWDGKGPQVGGHAIVIVGWGEEKGTKYWIIRNSWGANWGDGGYFKILRGENECGIEGNVFCLVPDFFYPTGYKLGDLRSSLSPDSLDTVGHTEKIAAIWDKSHGQNIGLAKTYRENRNEISDDLTITGGGIDPMTGYTRRVMVTMPWLNFERPVALEDLPRWKNFVAGLDVTPQKVQSVISKIDQERERKVIDSQVRQLYGSIMIPLVVVAIIVIILIAYHKLR